MNKKKLTEFVRLVVESVNEEMDEMWFSTNEAGLTSEMRDKLKREVIDCLMEYIQECGDDSMQHDEPLVGPHGPSSTSEISLKVDPSKKGVSLKGDWNTLPPK